MRNFLLGIFKIIIRPFLGSGLGRYQFIASMYEKIARYVLPDNKRSVMVNGYKLNVHHKHDGISMQLLLTGEYEPYETEIFKSYVKKGQCVIDIGANIGYYTLLAASLVGDKGKVYAFEPHPQNHNLLVNNVTENHYNNVIIYQNAVTNENKHIQLNIGIDQGTHSIENTRGTTGQSISIDGCTLDDLFQGKVKPDVIKMDIEGAETKALIGMRKMASALPNLVLLTECTPERFHELELFWKEIENCGFRFIYHIDDRKRVLRLTSLIQMWGYFQNNKYANLLCVKHRIEGIS